jgi:signal transduction histidine kinase
MSKLKGRWTENLQLATCNHFQVMAHNRWFSLFAMALLALAPAARGQRLSPWRVYNVSDDLPEPGCAAVSLAPQGKILVRTLGTRQLAELDGYNVVTSTVPDGVVGRIGESPSGQCWAMVPPGLAELRDGTWQVHSIPPLAAAFAASVSQGAPPIPFLPVRQGRVIFLLPDRLMDFSVDADGSRTIELRRADRTRIGTFTGMTAARDGGLWISGTLGLAKLPGPMRDLSATVAWNEYRAPVSLKVRDLRQPCEDDQGGVTAIAESADHPEPVVVHLDETLHWEMFPVGKENLVRAWRGPDQTIWGITRDSLWELRGASPARVNSEDLLVRPFNDIAVEPNGSFWLATADGLFRYALPLWQRRGLLQDFNDPVRCPVEDAEGRLWFLANGRLCRLAGDQLQEFPLPDGNPRIMQTARALFALKSGALVLDPGTGRCLEFQPGQKMFLEPAAAKDTRQTRLLGQTPDGNVWFQSFVANSTNPGVTLESYDGFRVQSHSALDVSADGPATTIFMAQNGDLWLGMEHSVARYHAHVWTRFASSNKTTPEGAVAFVELPDGKLWCAAPDRLWEFDGHSWSAVRAGFDRINGLIRVRDGSVWLASNNGLFHCLQGTWIENGVEEGLPSPTVRELYEDPHGVVWAATSRGLSRYFPDADLDPPKTFVRRLSDPNGKLLEGDTLNLWFSGVDRWKYTPAERLLYSFRLDQQDWSPYRNLNAVSLPGLAAGKHFFQARALDRNGNFDSTPAAFEFVVAIPWYEEKRLLTISLLGLAAVLFSAALALNRHRQLLRSYAQVEQKVAERTRELEVANRELLHSQKMNALGTLAAGIAHDFNNILSIIKGSAQIIEGSLDNPAKIRTRVDRIKTVVEQGAGIVEAMLGFSRSSDQQPSLCNLNTVVNDTVRLLGDRFLREVHVEFQPAGDLPEVAAPKDLLQQILLNFIFNAAESMTDRRSVRLTTRRLDRLPEEMALAPAPARAYAAISVHDSGCGIPPENLSRIFEPFFTTKALSTRRGTGLGLSMVYELAKKMNAGIVVESIVNRGSTFTLIVPIYEPPPAPGPDHAEEKAAAKSPVKMEL